MKTRIRGLHRKRSGKRFQDTCRVSGTVEAGRLSQSSQRGPLLRRRSRKRMDHARHTSAFAHRPPGHKTDLASGRAWQRSNQSRLPLLSPEEGQVDADRANVRALRSACRISERRALPTGPAPPLPARPPHPRAMWRGRCEAHAVLPRGPRLPRDRGFSSWYPTPPTLPRSPAISRCHSSGACSSHRWPGFSKRCRLFRRH